MFTRQSPWLLVPTVIVTLLAGRMSAAATSAEMKTLVSFAEGFDIATVTAQDAKPIVVPSDKAPVLQVSTGHAQPWPGITIKAPEGGWDLAAFAEIAVAVKNVAAQPVTVHLRVDCPGGDGTKNSVTGNVVLQPGQTRQLTVPLRRKLPAQLTEKLFGMRGFPGGYAKDDGLDVSRVTQLIAFVNRPQEDHSFQFGDIQAIGAHEQGNWVSMTPDEFFPMIDRFGQFIHKDWPGKMHSEEELQVALDRELADLQAQPGPADWDSYGGWAAGPQLQATGFFYAAKHAGKWWLVDPAGRLFWSHGVDCVGFGNGTTPITDREFYFADLPSDDSPLSRFYGRGSWAPHNYYENKGEYRTFNFQSANLLRKYGQDWPQRAAEMSHRRLRSWSMNTIANWSDVVKSSRCARHLTSCRREAAAPSRLREAAGTGASSPIRLTLRSAQSLEQRMNGERDKSVGDPFCIGYFVDNELGWGDELSLANAALASPPEQAAKREFLADLRQRNTRRSTS